MSITVTRDETREVHTYRRGIDIDGAAPILLERNYSHGGKEFLPDHAFAKWSHGEPIQGITLSGYVLKKDRTAGQQRTDVSYVTPASPYAGRGYQPDAPEWLLELFSIEPTP